MTINSPTPAEGLAPHQNAPHQHTFSVLPRLPEKSPIPPGLYMKELKHLSEKNLVFCFVGVGSAFARLNDQTSLIIVKNRKTILVDVGGTVTHALLRHGIDPQAFDYYHLTHAHADHIGGMEEVLFKNKYVLAIKPRVIITPNFAKVLWDNTLSGGIGCGEEGALTLNDYIEPIEPKLVQEKPREIYELDVAGMHLTIFRTYHVVGKGVALWSSGLMVDKRVLFTADTRFDPALFNDLDISGVETIFHDCQLFRPGSVHAPYGDLKTLSDSLKSKMYLTHYNDNFRDFNPLRDGFLGFAHAFKPYLWPLTR
jgi:ribonuclease BN (tRNA processing enzyme)